MTAFPASALYDESALREAYAAIRRAQPAMDLAGMAALLKIPEADLLRGAGLEAAFLGPSAEMLLRVLPTLGEITVITANALIVQQQTSVVDDIDLTGRTGRIAGPGLTLAVEMEAFRRATYVRGCPENGYRQGVFCFDSQGRCCLRLLLREALPDGLANRILAGSPRHPLIEPTPAVGGRGSQSLPFHRDLFLADWKRLRSPRDDEAVLLRHGLTERQALHHVAPGFAHAVDGNALAQVVREVANSGQMIRVSCHAPGSRLHHEGKVPRPCRWLSSTTIIHRGPHWRWLASEPAEAWVVRRPSVGGFRTALECFDREGMLGLRLDLGNREDTATWRDLLEELTALPTPLPGLLRRMR